MRRSAMPTSFGPRRSPWITDARSGSALINLSEILVLKCQHAEAHTAADQAVELLKPLAGPDAGPDSTTRDRWLLSMALTDRGVASKEAGDRDRAAHDFDEAARVAGSVAKDDEFYDDSQFQLACDREPARGTLEHGSLKAPGVREELRASVLRSSQS